ncbi:MAG: DHA2 family efflux MFS transporter permease subunit [Chitinophagaceae bacterium]|nr:MAG: DHA2 family efflux MFS transporter permease subunit [Chitinophagaceae bacterium]
MEAKTKAHAYPAGAAKWIIIITAISCALLEMIDATIVNVALPEISGSIGATRTEIAWVVTAYSIANAIVIPLSGMLSNLFGRKNYFTASVVVFTVCSLMCGMSTTLWTLVIWRFVQGLAGGGLLSTAQSIIIDAFPPEKINSANAIFGIGVVVGPIIGPVLGGTLVQNLSWHWIFFVNLPIGAAAALLSWMFISDLEGARKIVKMDWWGIIFLTIAVSSLQYVLEEGGAKDWFNSTSIVVLSIAAVLGSFAFITRELSTEHPAVDIRLLKNYNLALGNVINLVNGAVLMSSMFIFPLFVRVSLNWDSFQTGLYLMYLGIFCTVGIMLVKKLLDKGLSPKTTLLIGTTLISTYLFLMSFSAPGSHGRNFIFPFLVGGVGMAFFFMPVLSLSLSGLRGSELAQGAGLFNMIKRLGGAIGLAVMNIFINHQNAHVGDGVIQYANSYNPVFTERVNSFQQFFIAAGYATDDALQAAYETVSKLFTKQQLLVSYDHGYLMMSMVIILVCVPVILLIKKPKKEENIRQLTE